MSQKIFYRKINKLAESEKVYNYLFLLIHEIKENWRQNIIDGQIKKLTEIILDCIEKFAPLRILGTIRKSQWMTNQVKKHDQKEKQWFQKKIGKSFRKKTIKSIGNNATLQPKL